MTTIFEYVDDALSSLSPAVPYAMGTYLTPTGAALPDVFITYTLVDGSPEQSADDAETQRTYRVQVSIFSREGLVSLPAVDAAMLAEGFTRGPERALPYDVQTRHFGIAKDYFFLEDEQA